MDPKLIAARAEITAILKKHDIAGHVILHNAPGESEVFMDLQPSYSKLIEEGRDNEGVSFRLRSKLVDYGGDVDRQRYELEATLNMVSSIALHLANGAIPMLNLSTHLDEKTGAEHSAMERTEGKPQ